MTKEDFKYIGLGALVVMAGALVVGALIGLTLCN
tara:strand:+ start:1052 stop:1153 length:102 start_codon:yes stop_codon:yes gene_type:complete